MIRQGKTRAGDSWRTDQWILDMFPNAFDPCPYNPDWDESHYDGLVDDWNWSTGLVFINPPYSNPMPWVERAIKQIEIASQVGIKLTVVMLLKHDSSTRWYAKLHESGANFLMCSKRLKHQTSSGASFPSVLAVLS